MEAKLSLYRTKGTDYWFLVITLEHKAITIPISSATANRLKGEGMPDEM